MRMFAVVGECWIVNEQPLHRKYAKFAEVHVAVIF